MSEELHDGVYIGLREQIYFDQPRLGSTDLVKLLRTPADWWYSSRHNPEHTDDATPEREFGKALHTLILEGEDAYRRAVSVSPYDNYRTNEAKDWLVGEQAAGRAVLTLDMDRRVRHMAGLVLTHPQYEAPLREGLSEVSVLFHLGGQAMRARFDLLLPRFLLDLKSFGGHVRGRDVRDKALTIIADRDYDVQRYVYDVARQRAAKLITEGQVHGAAPDQLAWLGKLAGEEDWSWVWLFYQRRDDRVGRAPMVVPIERPRFDLTFDTGRGKAATAMHNYVEFVARFGLDEPWAVVAAMWRPNDYEFPSKLKDFEQASNDDQMEDFADAV